MTVTRASGAISEELTATIDTWADIILELGVRYLSIDDRGMFQVKPELALHVEKMVLRGGHVVVATDAAEAEFALVTRLSHLRPRLLLQYSMTPEEVWRVITEQTGDRLSPYQNLIQTICSCHPLLVHLFLAALCLRDTEAAELTAVTESLVDAITHLVQTQFNHPQGQVTFLLHLALNGDPNATAQIDDVLENLMIGTSGIRRLTVSLSGACVPDELPAALWKRLHDCIAPEAFSLARKTLLSVIASGFEPDQRHLGLVELFTGDAEDGLSAETAHVVATVADLAAPRGREEVLRVLPELIHDHSVQSVASRLAMLCSRVDIQALGPALKVLDRASIAPAEASEILSPLVVLEYPLLAASLAEKTLARLDPGDPRSARAALAWLMSSPATACPDPERRRRVLRHIVGLSHGEGDAAQAIRVGLASLRAFTRRSMCRHLRELTTASSLSSCGLPVFVCCLAGLAANLNDMTEQAAVWCWRARALSQVDNRDRIWVLISHALVAYRDQDFELTEELLAQAELQSRQLRAAAIWRCCDLALKQIRGEEASPAEDQLPGETAHPLLQIFGTYLAGVLDQNHGSTQAAIDKHFSIGQALESSQLTNPRIVDWQHQLREIFLSRNDKAIADCIHNDICAAEGAWRSLNGLQARNGAARTETTQRLSKSEWRVAEKIAAGCTSSQAAAALFLSKRTVDTHLRNIYRRLRLSGREELIAYVKEQNSAFTTGDAVTGEAVREGRGGDR